MVALTTKMRESCLNKYTIEKARNRDEAELVASSIVGDREALGLLLTKYRPQLMGFILSKRIGNEANAEEILHTSFEKIIKNIAKYNPERALFSTWLYTIVKRCIICWKRKKREVLEESVDENVSISPELVENQLDARKQLIDIADFLPEIQLETLLLYAEGSIAKEVAAELGTTRNAVNIRITRARQAVAAHIKGSLEQAA